MTVDNYQSGHSKSIKPFTSRHFGRPLSVPLKSKGFCPLDRLFLTNSTIHFIRPSTFRLLDCTVSSLSTVHFQLDLEPWFLRRKILYCWIWKNVWNNCVRVFFNFWMMKFGTRLLKIKKVEYVSFVVFFFCSHLIIFGVKSSEYTVAVSHSDARITTWQNTFWLEILYFVSIPRI